MSTGPDWYRQGLPHVFLPYATTRPTVPPLPVVAASGSHLHLADGRTLVDGIASWWTACHGYNHPHLGSAVASQLATLPHVMFGGLVHEPALTLARRLCNLTGLSRVFFTDSGSVAVEVALKLGLHYWRHHGNTAKTRFLAFRNAYHGDTFAAMSVSDPAQSIHADFAPMVPGQLHLPVPITSADFVDFERAFAREAPSLAGVLLEPLLQGAGGMKTHPPETVARLSQLCHRYDVLFIADEIATGFGRTGTLFAHQQAGITPDLLCLGKALTGGTISLAATLAGERVADVFAAVPLQHGPTYMANPLATAAGNASLDLFEREPRLRQVAAIAEQLRSELAPCRSLPGVVDVRVLGATGVVQLARPLTFDARQHLRQRFIDRGCFIRPLEDVVYLTPAFTISSESLSALTRAIVAELRDDTGSR